MKQEIGPGDLLNTIGLGLTAPQKMPGLVEGFDWSTTPLGHVTRWPDSLKAVVRILLTSRFPMWMAWGPELTFLLQRRLRRTTLGKKHPWALGKPAAQVWHEIWKEIGPRIERVMETGEASWDETLLLILERSGYPEETYHTFSYSPLSDPDGKIAGMLCVVMEDTVRVIGERQLASLSTLAGPWQTPLPGRMCLPRSSAASRNQKDMPCTLIYLFDEESDPKLVARTGIDAGHPAAPGRSTRRRQPPWPIRPDSEHQPRHLPSTILANFFPTCRRDAGTGRQPEHAWFRFPGKDRRSRWRLYRRAQSLPPVRCNLRGVPRSRRRPDRRQHHQRQRL